MHQKNNITGLIFTAFIVFIVLAALTLNLNRYNRNADNNERQTLLSENEIYDDISNINSENEEEKIILPEKCNNIICADDAIKNVYPTETLIDLSGCSCPLEESNLICKVELIRKLNDKQYYTLLKSKDGGYLYTLYDLKDVSYASSQESLTDEKHLITGNWSWYFKNELPTENDVRSKIIIGKTTLKEIRRMFLSSFTFNYSRGIITEILLADGTILSVKYDYSNNHFDDPEEELIASGYDDHSHVDRIFDYLLPIDKELLTKINKPASANERGLGYPDTDGWSYYSLIPYYKLRADNVNKADDIIKLQYPKEMLLNISKEYIMGHNYSTSVMAECVRKISEDEYYNIYRSYENGYFYIFYKKDDTGKYFVTKDYAYFDANLPDKNELLTNIQVDITTRKELEDKYPFAQLLMPEDTKDSSNYSTTDTYKLLMNNGYCAYIDIEDTGIHREEHKVKNIRFDSSNYMPYELLPLDKDLFESII